MKLLRLLSFITCLSVFCNSIYASNPAYTQRVNTYITNALANFNQNALPIQAYEGVPLDTASLNSTLSSIAAGLTSDFNIVQLIRVFFLLKTPISMIL